MIFLNVRGDVRILSSFAFVRESRLISRREVGEI